MKTKLKNRRTQLKRVFCVWMLLLIAIIHTNTAFAQVKESEAEKQTGQVQEKKEEKVLRFPNKLEAKEPPKNTQDSANSPNNKGIATEPSTSKAQLIENVNNANGNYPIHHGNATGEIKDKYSADIRFIDFKEMDISSHTIRELVADGKDVSEFLPYKVYNYIKEHNLYKD